MVETELEIMYRSYLRQKDALDKLWDNILKEILRQAKMRNIHLG